MSSYDSKELETLYSDVWEIVEAYKLTNLTLDEAESKIEELKSDIMKNAEEDEALIRRIESLVRVAKFQLLLNSED